MLEKGIPAVRAGVFHIYFLWFFRLSFFLRVLFLFLFFLLSLFRLPCFFFLLSLPSLFRLFPLSFSVVFSHFFLSAMIFRGF